jgi:hypothetical protein
MGHLVGQPSHPEHFAGLSITQNSRRHTVVATTFYNPACSAGAAHFYNLHLLSEPS